MIDLARLALVTSLSWLLACSTDAPIATQDASSDASAVDARVDDVVGDEASDANVPTDAGDASDADTITGPTLWVSPAGSDSNAGTQAAPFRTIQHAADVVSPGTTVVVEDGDYQGKNPSSCTSTCYVALLTTSGAANSPITFRAHHHLGASIDGNAFSTGYCLGLAANVAYVTIRDFDVTACRYGGFYANNSSNHHVTFAQNHIHGIAELVDKTCSGQGNVGIGSTYGSHDIVVDSNIIDDVGRLPGSGCNPSTLDYTNDHLIYMHGYNVTITNNVFYHAHSGWAIQITGGPSPDGTGWLVANNTIGPSNNAVAQGDFVVFVPSGNAPSGKIENNLSIAPNVTFLDLYSPGSAFAVANNLIGNAATLSTGSGTLTTSGNLMDVAPLLTNPTTFDYSLQSNSPAKGAGVAIPTVAHDINQTPRGTPPSIGAYE